MSKLTEDLTEFYDSLEKLDSLVQSIKAQNDWPEVSKAAHRDLNLFKINKYVKNISSFVSFPLPLKSMGRPVKYPDSEEEKERFKAYKKKGFSLRQIEEAEGLKKDVIAEKLKR
jgi:hypothetical protein